MMAVKEQNRSEKAEGQNFDTEVNRKSDANIVPKKLANNKSKDLTEQVEGRAATKRNMAEEASCRSQNRENESFDLSRVRQKARKEKQFRFTSLLHHITVQMLKESFNELQRDAVAGIDGETWYTYRSEHFEAKLYDLHERIHKGSYRAKLVERVYIEKEDGSKRPLGITSIEDKIVQKAVVKVLNQIYEEDFLGFSYGYREGRDQHNALDALYVAINQKKINRILDVDIQGFFDNISHEWMLKFLEHRIADKRILRLIRKWLKTGYMEEGMKYRTERGILQGSVISPLLSNIFLHYSFDQWVNQWRSKHATGDLIVVRYADDSIVGFQRKEDAQAFMKALRARLEKFELNLHPEKTRLIEFGRFAQSNRAGSGEDKTETFDFLGFTHICSKGKSGRFFLRRITSTKRFRKKYMETKAELRKRMHCNLRKTGIWLASVIRGFSNYFAVPGNMDSVKEFYKQCIQAWLRVLRKRSQKGAVLTWDRFSKLVDWLISRPRLVHPFPNERFAVRYSR